MKGGTGVSETWLTEWCSGVENLEQVDPQFWTVRSNSPVSYPESGHASIASVEDSSYWFNARNDIIVSAVRRFPPTGMIFDIGGGNGFVSQGLRKAGFSSVVVEPGAVGCQTARERGVPAIQAAFQDLPVPEASMPAAALFDVLEHIEDDLAALQNLHKALVPGGRLYIAVPAYNLLWSGEDVYAGHYRRHTAAGLRARLVTAGFAIEYSSYFFSALAVPIAMLRSLPFRLGIAKATKPSAVAKDHALPPTFIGKLLARSFHRERRRIETGKSIGFGSSCLVIGRKI